MNVSSGSVIKLLHQLTWVHGKNVVLSSTVHSASDQTPSHIMVAASWNNTTPTAKGEK